jgi:hypothetical protein
MRAMLLRLLPLWPLLAVFTVATPALAEGKMALLPLAQGAGAQEDVLRLEGALRASIESITGRSLESPASTRELMESARNLGVDCQPSELDCLLKLGVLVEIDVLLVPSVSLREDAFRIDLVLIDAREKSVKRAVQHTISPRSETFGKDVEGVAVDLLAPERYVGSLDVTSSHDGADVSIDDASRGTTPIGTIEGLKVGPHLVVVSYPGAAPVARNVDIAYGRTTALEATFEVDENAVVANGGGTTGGGGGGGGDLLFVTGATLAGIGGAIAVVATLGWIAADGILYTDFGGPTEREAIQNSGRVMLVTAAGAAVVGVVGGALIGVSLVPMGDE